MSKPAKTSLEAIQRAWYTLLAGDATLAALAPVYDSPPAQTEMPYIIIGGGVEQPRNTMGRTGRTCAPEVHVWTRSGDDFDVEGFAQAYQIAGRIDYLLDDATLDLSADGWVGVLCQLEDMMPLRDPDGITRRVRLVYRVLTEAA